MQVRTAFRTREELEEHEKTWLAPYAEKSALSRGRQFEASPHPYRTEFQKDRDRIIHTTAFRRLQYKTQVFVNYEGDYYRTRLTHTTEAAQLARTVARALRVNEELAEAITLAHDLGHSPFGHSGEVTLDQLMLQRMGLDPKDPDNKGKGYNHTVQSLRVVDRLEQRWPGFQGLNLTWETREGIVKHTTEYDDVPPEFSAPFLPELRASVEAQIVNYADELAYSVHDLDDGLRSGLLTADMPELKRLELWNEMLYVAEGPFSELNRHLMIRRLFDILVSDLVEASAGRIIAADPQHPDDVRRLPHLVIGPSDGMIGKLRELKDFLYENMYRAPRVVRMFRKAERVLIALFEAFEEDYRQLPEKTRARFLDCNPEIRGDGTINLKGYRVIADYIAGMTDRYALQEYQRLFDPFERA
jgi:dGTPase